jgi:hypothetical protein
LASRILGNPPLMIGVISALRAGSAVQGWRKSLIRVPG